MAISITMVPCVMAIAKADSAFPIKISVDVNGDTSSCSKEPSSRSRATDSPETIIPTTVMSTAKRPGTVDQSVSELGLNQVRATTTLGGPRRRPSWTNSLLRRSTISIA